MSRPLSHEAHSRSLAKAVLGGLRLQSTPAKMTANQAATLKRLAQSAHELDAFQPSLTRAEADLRIAVLTAKLKLLGEPLHTL